MMKITVVDKTGKKQQLKGVEKKLAQWPALDLRDALSAVADIKDFRLDVSSSETGKFGSDERVPGWRSFQEHGVFVKKDVGPRAIVIRCYDFEGEHDGVKKPPWYMMAGAVHPEEKRLQARFQRFGLRLNPDAWFPLMQAMGRAGPPSADEMWRANPPKRRAPRRGDGPLFSDIGIDANALQGLRWSETLNGKRLTYPAQSLDNDIMDAVDRDARFPDDIWAIAHPRQRHELALVVKHGGEIQAIVVRQGNEISATPMRMAAATPPEATALQTRFEQLGLPPNPDAWEPLLADVRATFKVVTGTDDVLKIVNELLERQKHDEEMKMIGRLGGKVIAMSHKDAPEMHAKLEEWGFDMTDVEYMDQKNTAKL